MEGTQAVTISEQLGCLRRQIISPVCLLQSSVEHKGHGVTVYHRAFYVGDTPRNERERNAKDRYLRDYGGAW